MPVSWFKSSRDHCESVEANMASTASVSTAASDLKARLEDADKHLRSLQKARKACRNALQSISAYRFEVMKFVFAHTGWNIQRAVSYAVFANRGKTALNEQAVRSQLEAWMSNSTQDEKNAYLAEGATDTSRRQFRSAQSYLREMNLHAWVEKENTNKGISPASRFIIEQRSNPPPPAVVEIFRESLPPPLSQKDNKWLKRWRKRWQVTVGTIGQRMILPTQIAQEKASWAYLNSQRNQFSMYHGITP